MYRIIDPTTGKFIELYELECLVAQAMDGDRSTDDLRALAGGYNPDITRRQIELLTVQLVQLGLLEDETTAPGHGKVIPLPVASQPVASQPVDEFAAFRNDLVLDLQHHEPIRWTDAPAPAPRPPLFHPKGSATHNRPAGSATHNRPAAPEPYPRPAAPEPYQGDIFGDTVVSSGDALDDDEVGADAWLAPPVVAPVAPVAPVAAVAVRAEPAPPAPAPEPAAPPATPETVETEQEALWRRTQVAKRRWYTRRAVLVVLALVAVVTACAFITYPLYVTSECAIVPAARAYVRSPISGTLAEILVDEGSPVRKGDVIARLDDRHLVSDRRKAIAETERIEAELQRLRHGARPEEISRQRAVLAARQTAASFAFKEARRRANMAKEGVGSRQAQDEAQLDLRIKQNAASEAAAALRLVVAGTRPEEIAALEAQLARAKAELDFVEQKLTDMVVIRAPIDGVVLTPKFRERLNENVEAGGLVCEIADMTSMRAEIFVVEREADTVALGMPVVVKVESYPLHPFPGKVGFVAPAVESRDKTNVVRVVATLDNRDGMLRQDMTGYGEVECGRRSLLDLATRRLLRWIRVRFLI